MAATWGWDLELGIVTGGQGLALAGAGAGQGLEVGASSWGVLSEGGDWCRVHSFGGSKI